MNHQKIAFRRKIIYIAAICLLIVPLFAMGQPSTTSSEGAQGSPGGELAKLRTKHDLSQANLSEIDPASETMKFATLGFRGVAANLLWTKANEYKMKKNWDRLSVTLNQIIKIQPNFMSVWEYQAHNLSYNVSVEFDDYQYRYHWVKKGLYFLLSGIAYNKRDYRILTNLGQFFGLKLGLADERIQFRRMFRKDTDFHNDLSGYITIDRTIGPEGPDNWLVSHEWYRRAERMVQQDPDVKVGGRAELMFYKDAPSQLRNYAKDLEEEFEPNERARRAWADALEAWREFGNRQILTSIGTLLVLNDEGRIRQRIDEVQEQLDELVPGARDQLEAEKLQALSPEEYDAYQKAILTDEEMDAIENSGLSPMEQRLELAKQAKLKDWELSWEERDLAYAAKAKMRISEMEVLELVDEFAPDNGDDAHRVFLELADLVDELQWIENYQNQVNYRYWEVRALSESTEDAIKARSALYDARKLREETILDEYVATDEETGLPITDPETGEPVMLPGARQKYYESFATWAVILKEHPDLIDDIASNEMMEWIGEYYNVLQSIDAPWPTDFPMQFLVDRYEAVEQLGLPTSEDIELRQLKEVDLLDDEEEDENDEASDADTSGDDTSDDTTTSGDGSDDGTVSGGTSGDQDQNESSDK